MTSIKVYLLAFGKQGQIRIVQIPHIIENNLLQTLEQVFHYGQNDFQQQPCPSVSVGDVIELNNDLFLVCPTGFYKMTTVEFAKYLEIPRLDRSFHAYDLIPNV